MNGIFGFLLLVWLWGGRGEVVYKVVSIDKEGEVNEWAGEDEYKGD